MRAAALEYSASRIAGPDIAPGADRALAAEADELDGPAGVDLVDVLDLAAAALALQHRGPRARIDRLDQAGRVVLARLLVEQPLQQVGSGREVLVDRDHHAVDRLALADDPADGADHGVQAGGDLAQLEDHRDEVEDERQDHEEDAYEQDGDGGFHQASSRILSRDPP